MDGTLSTDHELYLGVGRNVIVDAVDGIMAPFRADLLAIWPNDSHDFIGDTPHSSVLAFVFLKLSS